MKILRPSGTGVAGIFFPIGKPPDGTCQYASKECPKVCYAMRDKDYDETVNIPEDEKKQILQFFIGTPIVSVCSEIMKEMEELQAIILCWFTSGDCLDEHIDRFYKIMLLLQEEGIIQNGFTRNNKLYQKLLSNKNVNYDILRLVFTIEKKGKAYSPSCSDKYPKGIYAVPDYEKGAVALYNARLAYNESYGSCGWNRVKHFGFNGSEIEIATNCLGCFKKKIGCFIDLPEIGTGYDVV